MSVKERPATIYALRNTINDKNYVGSTVKEPPEVRYEEHRSNLNRNKRKNIYLQNAWNKHGVAAFEFALLERCLEKDRWKREQWWIRHLKSSDPNFGYNIIHPVRSMAPAPIRSRISKEIWLRPGLKEANAKQSAERWNDPAYKARMTAVSLAQWQDKGRQDRHKARLKKRWSDPKQREALIARNKARWADPEQRKAHSTKLKALWQTEDYSSKVLKTLNTPDRIVKLYLGNKAYRDRQKTSQ